MSSTLINYYQKVIDIIQSQFDSMLEFNGNVEVFDEQVYMSQVAVSGNPMKRGKFYVTVKFGSSTSNLWQINLPVSLTILCEKNKFEEAKYLFTQYTLKYNISDITVDSEYRYLQYYSTPTVSRSFADIGNGFYTMLSMNGQFLFGLGSDFISQILYFDEDQTEVIKFLGTSLSLQNNLDSQPFPDLSNNLGSHQLAESVSSFGVFGFGLSSFFTKNSKLLNSVKELLKPTRNLNTTFTLGVVFASDVEGANQVTVLPEEAELNSIVLLLTDGRYYKCTGNNQIGDSIWTVIDGDKYNLKLSSFSLEQKIGELTSVTMSFTH